jgi:lipopolysaccharide biosynthesis glycosyltransferase
LAKEAAAVHVVLAVYDPRGVYSKHSGVVMASIFERTKSPVRVHILHDGTMTDQNRSLLLETAVSFGQQAEFHDVSSFVGRMGDDAVRIAKEANSVGMLFRLLIPEVLPLDKVIYLDCDIVVNMDIRELWDIPLEDRSIAAVPDRGKMKPYRRFSSTGLRLWLIACDRGKYINSGVLLMNLSRIREKYELIRQGINWFKRYGHIAETVDQDMINSCFRGDIKIIESRFNNCHDHDGDISDSILHAICSPKPWDGPKFTALDRMYWKTFLKTPWGRLAPDEVLDLMFDVMKDSPFTHRHTGQCYRKVFSRFYKDVIRNEIAKMILIMCKELRYRLVSWRRR